MVDANQHQGQFGEDYVRVLASAAGLAVLDQNMDNDGVDLGFRANGLFHRTRSPRIEAQVKTWSSPGERDGPLRYAGLNEWQFNRLAGKDWAIPRYLFVICVPKNADDYATFSSDGVLLRHLGFYVSLRNEATIENPDRERRAPVFLPRANVLTADTLRRLTQTPGDW
jgi:hypothetical protein